MSIEVEAVPYTAIVLHALKYPSKGICGLLLGSKTSKGIKVEGAVPICHEASPLAPQLEIALSLVAARHSNLIGTYFANANILDKSFHPSITRLSERIASATGNSGIILQVINWKLSPDCPSNCIAAQLKSGESWIEAKVFPAETSLTILRTAINKKMYRSLADFDNHLDRPEVDFFNTDLYQSISKFQ